jgi:hypothetical protein
VEILSKNSSAKSFWVHAFDEIEAIQEFNRRTPANVRIIDYHIVRVRRTIFQRLANSLPRWKITYTMKATTTEADKPSSNYGSVG